MDTAIRYEEAVKNLHMSYNGAELSAKMKEYISNHKLPPINTIEKAKVYQSPLNRLCEAEESIAAALIAQRIPPEGKAPASLDEAQRAYRACLEETGVRSQTAKLITVQTVKDMRALIGNLYPDLPAPKTIK